MPRKLLFQREYEYQPDKSLRPHVSMRRAQAATHMSLGEKVELQGLSSLEGRSRTWMRIGWTAPPALDAMQDLQLLPSGAAVACFVETEMIPAAQCVVQLRQGVIYAYCTCEAARHDPQQEMACPHVLAATLATLGDDRAAPGIADGSLRAQHRTHMRAFRENPQDAEALLIACETGYLAIKELDADLEQGRHDMRALLEAYQGSHEADAGAVPSRRPRRLRA